MDKRAQQVIILATVLLCATILAVAVILKPADEPPPRGSPVTFCPPRLRPDC